MFGIEIYFFLFYWTSPTSILDRPQNAKFGPGRDLDVPGTSRAHRHNDQNWMVCVPMWS